MPNEPVSKTTPRDDVFRPGDHVRQKGSRKVSVVRKVEPGDQFGDLITCDEFTVLASSLEKTTDPPGWPAPPVPRARTSYIIVTRFPRGDYLSVSSSGGQVNEYRTHKAAVKAASKSEACKEYGFEVLKVSI